MSFLRKVLHISRNYYQAPYKLNDIESEVISNTRDLGIQNDKQLKFYQQTSNVVSKANQVLSLINKSFKYLTTTL